MSASYRDDAVLAPASVLRPGEIERLNAILDDAGLGRPLQPPEASTAATVVLPLAGADPLMVRDGLRRAARERGVELPDLTPDYQYVVDTVEAGARDVDLVASGKKSGHGTVAWVPVPRTEMPDAPPWRPVERRPVVALLDSGVRDHAWLPHPGTNEPFYRKSSDWPVRVPIPPLAKAGNQENFGSHWGHATFIAGLVRLAAPDVQVLSLRVMNDAGRVSEVNVIAALDWLAGQLDAGDVVCMAFGRPRETDDDGGKLRDAIDRLGRIGVRIVASAGNDGVDRPTIPACFATEPDSPVVSVGAGRSETDRASYSNHGSWVKTWRPGSALVSIMPLRPYPAGDGDGYARWSGTSFAAASYAGELAQAALAAGPPIVGGR